MQGHQNAAAEAHDVGDVQAQPGQPCREAGELRLTQLDHGVEAGDNCHGALVKVVKRLSLVCGGLLIDLGLDELAHVVTALDGHLGNARKAVERNHVTDDVDVLVLANGQVLVDGDAACTVGLHTSLVSNELAQRGSGHTGGPNLGCSLDGDLFVVLHVLVGHSIRSYVRHHGVEANIDTELLQGALSLAAETLAKRRQHLRGAVEEVNLGRRGSEVRVLAGEGALRKFSDLTGELHTGRASTNDDKGEQLLALCRILFQLCLLEGGDDAGADLKGIIQGLHTRCVLGEVVVTKVGLAGTSSDDEGVILVGAGSPIELSGNGLVLDVDISDLAVHEVGIVLVAQDLARGRGDLARGDNTGGYLVEHRLEEVVVLLVDEGDLNVCVLELLHGIDAAEACTDNNDVVAAVSWTVGSVRHSDWLPSSES